MASLSFSIVTPTLNAERYMDECLRSVREQAMADIEHLVIDGGSTDRTLEIAQRSGATWISRPGLRQAAAINLGFSTARGDIVAWLNADDCYMPGALRKVAEHLSSHPEADVVIGDCEVIGERGERLRVLSPGKYDFRRLLRMGNSIAQPAVFFRKTVFDKVGFLDENLEFGMDYELWLRLARVRVDYLPQVLAAFRWHPESKTARNTEGNWRELLAIVRRHGGGWTPQLVWTYVRARATLMRQQLIP
jgi:glycosyltransferase involved in cell wall biosynthesis